jgi:propanol-preferring alcohol dehydrogenase
MRAMQLKKIAALADIPEPLQLVEVPVPALKEDQILMRIAACGVCHTELDEIEGRTPPAELPIIPGHEVIGYVEQIGAKVALHKVGDRVGVGWIYTSSGSEYENLSSSFVATGRDANGGYAEFMAVGQDYAFHIPKVFSDAEAAPLLCAGAVGYRALRITGLQDGDSLGLTGFGGSGHLVMQLARHLYPHSEIFVFARSHAEQDFARDLGAAWAGDIEAEPPRPLRAIIDTTPAWRPVLASLRNLEPGGRLVINAIRKETGDRSIMAEIDYAEHLWMEKELKTVANVTGEDIAEFLQVAAEIPLRPTVRTYPLEQANKALQNLREGHIRGANVLLMNSKHLKNN